MFNLNPEYYSLLIRKMLIYGTYRTSEYKRKYKNDKGKMREIFVLPYYPDRIIHHAIMQVLEPIWKKTFINNTYQSIKGRGVHKCKKHLEKVLLDRNIKEDIYCFKFYRECILLRDSIVDSFRKCEARKEVLASYNGWLIHCDGYNLLNKYKKEKLNET